MATVENRFDMHAEKNGGCGKSGKEVSFRIDGLVGEDMQLVPDRAEVDRDILKDMMTTVCASLWPVLQRMAGGICKCTGGDVAKVKVALQRHDFRIDEVEQYCRRDNIVVHGLQEEDGESTNGIVIAVAGELRSTTATPATEWADLATSTGEAIRDQTLCGSCDVTRGQGFSVTRESQCCNKRF